MLQLFITLLTLISKVIEYGAAPNKENEMCVVVLQCRYAPNSPNGLKRIHDLAKFEYHSV